MFPAQWAVILHILLITCSEFEALQVGPVNVCLRKNNSRAPREREGRESVAPYLRKCGNLPIQEILVITWPSARPPVCRLSAPQA